MTTYTVNVTNNNSTPLCPFIYQGVVQYNPAGMCTNAWLSNNLTLSQGQTVQFQWTINWGVRVGDCKLEPHGSYTFKSDLDANPGDVFENSDPIGGEPTITWESNNGTPNIEVLVPDGFTDGFTNSILMDGSPIMTCPASAGVNIIWSMTPSYTLCFGNFLQGQIVSEAETTAPCPISFGIGQTTINATFGVSGGWSLNYQSSVQGYSFGNKIKEIKLKNENLKNYRIYSREGETYKPTKDDQKFKIKEKEKEKDPDKVSVKSPKVEKDDLKDKEPDRTKARVAVIKAQRPS